MAYGTKPAGKAKPSTYPYGQSGGESMGIVNKGSKGISREVNRGPGTGVRGRIKGSKRSK